MNKYLTKERGNEDEVEKSLYVRVKAEILPNDYHQNSFNDSKSQKFEKKHHDNKINIKIEDNSDENYVENFSKLDGENINRPPPENSNQRISENEQTPQDHVLSEKEIMEKVLVYNRENSNKNYRSLKTRDAQVNYVKNILQNIEQSKIFVFFYKDYQPQCYYWECLIFLRKFILTFLSSMSETLPKEFILFAMIIIIYCSIYLTNSRKPYKLPVANRAELYSLNVCAFTIFSELIFKSDSPEKFINFIGVMCILFNLVFFAFVLYSLVIDAVKRYQIIQKNKFRTNSIKQPVKVTKLLNSKKYVIN